MLRLTLKFAIFRPFHHARGFVTGLQTLQVVGDAVTFVTIFDHHRGRTISLNVIRYYIA